MNTTHGRVKAPSNSLCQTALSCTAAVQFWVLSRFLVFRSRSSLHLVLGCPTLLARCNSSVIIFLGISQSLILATWPAQHSRPSLIIHII